MGKGGRAKTCQNCLVQSEQTPAPRHRPGPGCSGRVLVLCSSGWGSLSRRAVCSALTSAGVCLGMQLAVVEFARNVLGWQGNCTKPFLGFVVSLIA